MLTVSGSLPWVGDLELCKSRESKLRASMLSLIPWSLFLTTDVM